MDMQHHLDVEVHSLDARIEINDVPIWSCAGRGSQRLSRLVNPWIAAGHNAVRVRFDWPDDVPYAAGIARVAVRLEQRPASRSSTPPQALAAAEWPNGAEEAYPDALALQFEVQQPPPSRLWSQATPIDLTPTVHAEVSELLGRVHHAVAARDVDRAAEMLDYRAVDTGRCYFMTSEDARRAQWSALESLTTAGDGRLEPLDPDALEMHLVADRRLIWVTRPERAPALAVTTPTGRESMQLYVARVNDTWTVVR